MEINCAELRRLAKQVTSIFVKKARTPSKCVLISCRFFKMSPVALRNDMICAQPRKEIKE